MSCNYMNLGIRISIAITIALTLAVPLHAAELARLANGFSLSCDHHAMVDGKVRLYTKADSSSYIDFAPDEISGFERLPDAPSASKPPLPAFELTKVDIDQILSSASQSHNVDIDLLASVVKAESGGNTHAVSRAGARGLMQLMPATAANLGVEAPNRPDQNVQGGSTYLDQLLTRYHDNLALALAAYNAGPATVDRYHGIPPYRETRLYVARVIHEFNRRVRARGTD